MHSVTEFLCRVFSMQMGMTRRCLGRSAAAAKEEEEDKKRLKQVNNACSLFLNRPGQLPPG